MDARHNPENASLLLLRVAGKDRRRFGIDIGKDTKSSSYKEVHMTTKTLRYAGALALLIVGGVHLQQYLTGYSVVPTIGALFILNAVGAAAVAAGLLAPIERLLSDRRVHLATGVLAALGAMIAVGALVALFISESQPLFGFMEGGYSTPIVIAIAAEVITTLLLVPVAVASLRRAASDDRPPRFSQPVGSH